MFVLISTSGLVIVSAAFFIHDLQTIQKDTLQHINTLVYVIEKDVSAALAFNDQETAKDTLSALKVHKDVLKVCIFDINQNPFSSYSRTENDETLCKFLDESSGYQWREKYIDVVKTINFDNEKYGTLLVHYSLETILNQFKTEAIISFSILSVSMFFIFFMSFQLGKFIIKPILDLKKTARRISRNNDHSIRAQKKYPDEVGELVDSFNSMLDEIQHRDAELEKQNELLEFRVNERTLQLQKRKEDLENANLKLETAVKRAEEMTQAAEKANKYKSQFLASMSHEIRTPMNAILGFTELLEESIDRGKEQEYLKSISNAGKTLLNLINEILDLSKIEAGKLKLELTAVDLRELFNEIRQIFSKSVEDKNLDFNILLDPDLPNFIEMDGIRLRQVLFNLVGNAVKFTEKGKIELKVDTVFSENSKKVALIIKVIDTGVGIAKDQMDVIFEAFRQQKNQSQEQYGGTGLGLTISKRLLTMMNGSIEIESESGKGSTFTMTINDIIVVEDESKASLEVDDNQYRIDFHYSTLLIVDDHETNRSLMKGYLLDKNLNIIEAENGKQALEYMLENVPDLVLMDMKMPVMDGYEATKIAKNTPEIMHIPIIAVTASGMDHNVNSILNAGCDQMFKKPISRSDLYSLLMEYLPHVKNLISEKNTFNDNDLYNYNDIEVTPETIKDLPEFLKLYESSLLPRLNEIKQVLLISDINDFATDIERLGKKFNFNFLTAWSRYCIKCIDSFDVDKIMAAINTFPNLVEKLVSTVEQYHEKQ